MFSFQNSPINFNEYINCIENICRLCLNKFESNELVNIFQQFDPLKENESVAEFVADFARIPITKEDSFSKMVCKGCLKQLNEIEVFRRNINCCNEFLNNLLASYNEAKEEFLVGNNKFEPPQNVMENIKEVRIKNEKRDVPDDEEESKIDVVEHELSEAVSKTELGENSIRDRGKAIKINGKTVYPCTFCIRTFRTKRGRDLHLIKHTGNYLKCRLCDRKYRSDFLLRQHETTHNENNDLKCKQCGRQFGYQKSLRFHMETHKNEQNYQCEQCGKWFSHHITFKSHLSRHEQSKYFINCKICQKRIQSSYGNCNMRAHLRTHLQNRGKPCPKCEKKFTTTAGLKAHLKNHAGQFDFKCDLCPKQYSSKKGVKEHFASVHSGVKQFSCEICGKAFALKGTLNQHVKIHAIKKKPSVCMICEKDCKYPSRLIIHMRSVHKLTEN